MIPLRHFTEFRFLGIRGSVGNDDRENFAAGLIRKLGIRLDCLTKIFPGLAGRFNAYLTGKGRIRVHYVITQCGTAKGCITFVDRFGALDRRSGDDLD